MRNWEDKPLTELVRFIIRYPSRVYSDHLENNILFPRAVDLESKAREALYAGAFGENSHGR